VYLLDLQSTAYSELKDQIPVLTPDHFTMADDNHNPSIDESPISPVERRDSLEKHLQQRPDPKDLKDRHILLDTNAAP